MSNLQDQPKINSGKPLDIDVITRLCIGVFCLFTTVVGFALYRNLWVLDQDGLSILSKTTPYWDFNNLWVGSKLALQGNVEALFNLDVYRAEMDTLLRQDVPDQEWSYPPSMLLFGAPLAMLPILPAYLLWIFGTTVLFHLALRQYKLPILTHLAILFGPPIIFSALFGQNGAFISALLLASLVLLPTRPILAGIFIGLLTIKPHFGILIPFILIASGNWRAFISASVTSIALVLATGIFFGFGSWLSYLNETQPMMTAIMEAPYKQPYQTNAATMFILIRAMGGSLAVSYFIQFMVSLGCLIYAVSLWRKNNQVEHNLRVAITLVLIFLATPYAYTYDMAGICAAIGIFYVYQPKKWILPILGLAWIFPMFNHVISTNFDFNFGGMVLSVLLLVMLWHVHVNKKGLTASNM
jgi:hypothetical protein